MKIIGVETSHKRQVIDVTEKIEALLDNNSGVAHVFVSHTTAAITTADLDPGTDLDLLDALDGLLPTSNWRHPHDPSHTPDHLLASIIGPSVSIPFRKGQLSLGTWQRIVLIELDGPRHRQVTVGLVFE